MRELAGVRPMVVEERVSCVMIAIGTAKEQSSEADVKRRPDAILI